MFAIRIFSVSDQEQLDGMCINEFKKHPPVAGDIEPVLIGAGFDLDELAAGMEYFIQEAGGQYQTQEE